MKATLSTGWIRRRGWFFLFALTLRPDRHPHHVGLAKRQPDEYPWDQKRVDFRRLATVFGEEIRKRVKQHRQNPVEDIHY